MAHRPALSAPFSAIAAQEAIVCLGLGGGADAISAAWVATILERHGALPVAYANTRPRFDEHVTQISAHIGRLEGPRHALNGHVSSGSTEIDRSLPKGPGGSPLVVRLDPAEKADAVATLAPEIDALGYSLVIGVDAGGDVLSRRREARNRDRIMLRVLYATHMRVLVFVIGPGCDGTRLDRIRPELLRVEQQGGCLADFDLAPYASDLDALSAGLPDQRTPKLVLRAMQLREQADAPETMRIPRGSEPVVPLSLLTRGFLLTAEALL